MIVCEEMKKLRKMLDKKGIEWHDASETVSERKDWPIWYCRTRFEYNGLKFSVINGFGSYGGWYGANPGMSEEKNMGLLELMIEENDPVGWLKAEDIMEILGEKRMIILDYIICFICKHIPLPKKIEQKLIWLLVNKIRK